MSELPRPVRQRRSIAYRRIGTLTILVHNSIPVRDDEWAEYVSGFIKLATSRYSREVRTLVVSPSGQAPNARQRQRINDLSQGVSYPTAVLTDHWGARAVVTAFSWFNPGIRAFSTRELGPALVYLDLPPSAVGATVEVIGKVIDELFAELEAQLTDDAL